MNRDHTRAYIERRLTTAGWRGDPHFSDGAHGAIHPYAGALPRVTDHVCDRLLLRGFLDGLHAYSADEVATVVSDIESETGVADDSDASLRALAGSAAALPAPADALQHPALDQRLVRVERSKLSLLHMLRKSLSISSNLPQLDNIE